MTEHILSSIDDLLRSEQVLIRSYQHLSDGCNDQQLKIVFEKLEARHRLQYERLLQQLN